MGIPPCGRKRKAGETHPAAAPKNWQSILKQFLKRSGLRATEPRDRVAAIAMSRKTHFDIQSLIKGVSAEHPEISPATVYRSVKTLCEAGLLTETLQGSGGVALYEASAGGHHDHVVCTDCGEIFEFHNDGLEKAQEKAIHAMGFREVRHQHVVYANCLELEKLNS